MFYECSSLTSLNLSNFNINNATNMDSMFYECSMSFDLEDLFYFEGKNHFGEINNNFDKYIFSGCIFKTNSKS